MSISVMDALRQTITAIKNWTDENKVQKVSGKGLSTNDYTTADKNKVASIPSGEIATKVYVNDAIPSWAKAATKPSYTAGEVGADTIGTAASLISSHNTAQNTHNDIRNAITQKSQVQIITWEADD